MGIGLAIMIVLGSFSHVQAGSIPRIGAKKAVFDRVWGSGARCNHYGPNLECYYHTSGIGVIDAQFGSGDRAVQIQIGGYANSGTAKWWTFLTGLLPVGSQKSACKHFSKTPPPTVGAARACVYTHNQHTLLVVQVLHGNKNSAVLGFVERDGSLTDLSSS